MTLTDLRRTAAQLAPTMITAREAAEAVELRAAEARALKPQGVVDQHPLVRAKFAYSTRFVAELPDRDRFTVDVTPRVPAAGDVVVAKVLEVGQHKRLEGPDSRRQTLFPGDIVVVAYGARYAPDQFLSILPESLGPCHLAAAGGLASLVIDQHTNVAEPTLLEPVGLLATAEGRILNLRDVSPHQIVPEVRIDSDVPVIAVLGTSMNSGKSTALACLARGLALAGLRVHAGKATGTGAGNDARLYTDAGATKVLDFTDFGLATTFSLEYGEVRDLFCSMVSTLSEDDDEGRPDVVLIEIADGVYQGETARLLADNDFGSHVDGLIFAAGDALGAAGGVHVLRELGREPRTVSGLLTSSPLATHEAQLALDIPVTSTYDMCNPTTAKAILNNELPEVRLSPNPS